MTELTTTRTLEVVAAEIRTFTASMLNNIIEIGRRMCEAKELLPYGQFGDWVKENTGYSKSTANNFMRIFEEYGASQGSLFGEVEDVQTFGKLSYSKALTLLQLPAGEREEFAKANNVEEMSVRELKEAIRERDEARRALEETKEDAEQAISDAEEAAEKAEKEASALRAELEELRRRPVEVAVQEPSEADLEKARTEEREKYLPAVEALEKKLADAEAKAAKEAEKAKKLKDKVDKAGEEAKAAVIKEINEATAAKREAEAAKADAEARAEALEKKLKTADGDTAVFQVYFQRVQEDVNRMLGMIQKADEGKREKYRAALRALITGVEGQI